MRRREFITLLWSLLVSHPTCALAQEDHVVTAQTTASSRSDACTSSSGKAYNLFTIQGWFNVTRLNCECTQSEAHGLPTWECVATATCNVRTIEATHDEQNGVRCRDSRARSLDTGPRWRTT